MSHAPEERQPAPTDEPSASSRRFRFKRKHSRRTDGELDDSSRHRTRHGHSHHRKRRRLSPRVSDDPSAYDDSVSGLPSDVAFRESLFDALGDDEGAAFWQQVYGQPIHNYDNTYQDEETGELERMNDEEYAQYVRRKMWEKSWEGIEAAKEEKRKEREQEKQKIRDEEQQRKRNSRQRDNVPRRESTFLFDLDIEDSLRRGEHRRRNRQWKTLWNQYLQRWTDLLNLYELRATATEEEQLFLRNKIAWPLETGMRKDLNAKEIERFIRRCAESIDSDGRTLSKMLKAERVRWHPDKIQQRYGFMNIDQNTMQGVTEVFQVFDRMWNEVRGEEH